MLSNSSEVIIHQNFKEAFLQNLLELDGKVLQGMRCRNENDFDWD